MKYFLIATLVLSLGYLGYYVYDYDKNSSFKNAKTINTLDTENSISTESNIQCDFFDYECNTLKRINSVKSFNVAHIPEYLTPEFWQNITPGQLKERLKNIENINEDRYDNKRTMLHMLVLHGKYPEMVDILVSAGANVYYRDNSDGNSLKPLHYAVMIGSYEFTEKLLKYDKNINETGLMYWGGALEALYLPSPFLISIFCRAPFRLIQLLLDKGANPHARDSEVNAIAVASISYTRSTCISRSGATSIPNTKKMKESYIDHQVIKLLLDYKLDIKYKDRQGKSAYDYMKENEEFTKTELFKKISNQFQK